MFEQFRKLIQHSSIYGLSLIGNIVANLVITPILLHRLSRAEYGMTEMLNVFSSMVLNLSTLGISSVLIKVYVNDCETDRDRKSLISSTIMFTTLIAIVLSAVTYLFASHLSQLFFKDGRYGILLQLGVGGSGLLLIQQMTLQCMRAKQWPGTYALVTGAQIGVVLLMNLYLVYYRGMGVYGIQVAAISGAAVALLLGLLLVRSELIPRFSRTSVWYVLTLSLPMIPSAIVPWVLNWSDRYFLNYYWGLSETGLYAVGYKIGMLGMMMLINTFQLGWTSIFFANRDSEAGPILCASVFKYFMMVLVATGLLISVCASEILRVIATKEYWGASWIIPLISVAYVMYGAQFFFTPMFVGANKNKWLGTLMLVMAVINTVLNITLIPRFGITGAVSATVSTFIVWASATLILSNKFYPVKHKPFDFAKLLVAAAVTYFVFVQITGVSSTLDLPKMVLVRQAFLKTTCIPGFIVLLFVFRFFGSRELEIMRSMPKRLVQKVYPERAHKLL